MPFITERKASSNGGGGSSRRVEKGALENARKSLSAVLEERFGTISAHDADALAAIDDPQRLTILMRAAVKAQSLKEFLSVLKG